MDLALHFRVLSRYRRFVVGGLALAVLLALLAYVRIGPNGISYRQAEKWQSVARLFATTNGNPFSPTSSAAQSADPTTVAVLAAEFANSDAVTSRLERNGGVNGQVVASANQVDGQFVPFIDVAGIASTPAAATDLARRAANAMSQFVIARQASTGVKPARRISLQLVNAPEEPTLVDGRSKTLPVMAFLAIVSLTLGLVYVRENLRTSASRPTAVIEQGAPISAVETPETAVQAVRQGTVDGQAERLRARGTPRPGPTLGTGVSQTARPKP